MSDQPTDPEKKPRKKPKFTLLQTLFLVGLVGVILTVAHQYGAF